MVTLSWSVAAFFFVAMWIATGALSMAIAGSIVFVLFAMRVTVMALHIAATKRQYPMVQPQVPERPQGKPLLRLVK